MTQSEESQDTPTFVDRLRAREPHLVNKLDIQLITGQDETGKDAYYFIQCGSEYLQSIKLSAAQYVNLKDPAITVICYGYGKEPTEDHWKYMLQEYGFQRRDYGLGKREDRGI